MSDHKKTRSTVLASASKEETEETRLALSALVQEDDLIPNL
jgi:hypothetical protein